MKTLTLVAFVFITSFFISYVIRPLGNTAGIFFVDSIDAQELKKQSKIKVLIVPGHEPNFGGTEYGGIKERDIAVQLSDELTNLFKYNGKFIVTVTRDTKEWNPVFETYFKENWEAIKTWKESYQKEMNRLVENKEVVRFTDGVPHNDAPPEVARRLYGINKWGNENNMDILIHIHFNDNPRRYVNRPGDYSGFAIYVPEGQYSNASATNAVAKSIENRLARFFPESSLPKEKGGIVEDQELVAIGRHNTVNAVSFLVEYGYIYEPWLQSKETRDVLIREMAFQTYLGIQDFFIKENEQNLFSDTRILPYHWESKEFSVKDTTALQFALMKEGLYPPLGKTKNECGITGKIGPCTKASVNSFFKKYQIKESSLVEKLNSLYAPSAI